MTQTTKRHREYMAGWNKVHRLSVKDTQYRITDVRKRIILAAKNKPCADCRGWFNSWQMQFDHREPNTKKFNVGGSYTRSIKDLKAEINKCDVVCANCHADRTYKQGHKAQKDGKIQ
jgi:hypothetical protein